MGCLVPHPFRSRCLVLLCTRILLEPGKCMMWLASPVSHLPSQHPNALTSTYTRHLPWPRRLLTGDTHISLRCEPIGPMKDRACREETRAWL